MFFSLQLIPFAAWLVASGTEAAFFALVVLALAHLARPRRAAPSLRSRRVQRRTLARDRRARVVHLGRHQRDPRPLDPAELHRPRFCLSPT